MKKITLFAFLMLFSFANAQTLEGTWKVSPQAGALGVGPSQGNISWWSNSLADVTTRACFFDDEYIFNANGTFNNVVGTQTWIEGWQGGGDACGTPVAPHNGSNSATWTYNSTENTITLTGVGAYLGLPKAYNGGELTTPANAPASITYTVSSFSASLITLDIAINGGWWRFVLAKQGVTPTCNDGIQNGDETGIDCGGSCPNSCLTQIDLPVTFEGTSVDYTVTDFGGNASTKVVDPTNASNTVIQTIKTGTAELWAGTTIGTGSGFSSPIPFTASNTKMSVRVWSPDAGIQVRLKVEDANDPTHSCETEATTTVAGGWQTMEFNFANQASGTAALNLAYTLNKASIFFNFGTTGSVAGEKTYYFDDVNFVGTPGETVSLPLTFESSTLVYSFSNFGGATTTKIANPDPTGANTTANVAQLTKGAGSEVWAGSYIELGAPIDFSTNQAMKIKTWSPQSGITVKMKLENFANPNINTEVDVTNTVANAWEELTFNFPGIVNANNYQRVVVFFNFGANGTGENYYFDEINSAPLLSNSQFAAANVALYPNPATTTVTFESAKTIDSIEIYNVLGQKVMQIQPTATVFTFDVSSLETGVYIVKSISEGIISSQRFIKK